MEGRLTPAGESASPSRGPCRGAALVAGLLPLCWLAMQAVHEAGHVLAAVTTGGTVTAVVLHPLAISRTDVAPNPRPRVVVWGGPLVGALVPCAAWSLAAAGRVPSAYLWRFFAGFCLIANGGYLGCGLIEPVGDAADLLRLGTPAWTLGLFGAVALPAGLALWRGQGRFFGFGPDARPVPFLHVWGTGGWLVAVIAAEVLLSRR